MNLQKFVIRKGQFSCFAPQFLMVALLVGLCDFAAAQDSQIPRQTESSKQGVAESLFEFDSAFATPASQESNQAPNKFSMSAKGELSEILKLRDQLGGVNSLFPEVENSDLKRQMETEFNAELQRLAQNDARLEQRPRSSNPFQLNQTGAVWPESSNRPTSSLAPEMTRTTSPNQVQPAAISRPRMNGKEKATLLQVSRELESLAWRLEEIEAYQAADQIRDQATQLRLDCRAR